jgi:hypothetical protein
MSTSVNANPGITRAARAANNCTAGVVWVAVGHRGIYARAGDDPPGLCEGDRARAQAEAGGVHRTSSSSSGPMSCNGFCPRVSQFSWRRAGPWGVRSAGDEWLVDLGA